MFLVYLLLHPRGSFVSSLVIIEKQTPFFQTKGLSLEEIDLLYQNTIPRRSVSYRQQLKHVDIELSVGGTHTKHDSASDQQKV